jgi:Cu/Ag efflux pump CusA
VVLALTGTTLNIQSLIGAIMAVGVAMANAILLVTFAESRRRSSKPAGDAADGRGRREAAREAAVEGASRRLRPILMTTCAMIAGMLPMALAWGESGQQNAPLGRAVIGGLAAATVATLFVLPSIFALVQSRATTVAWAAQTDLPRQVVERSMNVPAIQAVPPTGDEQIGGNRPFSPMSIAASDVVAEHFTG